MNAVEVEHLTKRDGDLAAVDEVSFEVLDGQVLAVCWAVSGLAAAVVLFRWEPHRPAGRGPARTGQARAS